MYNIGELVYDVEIMSNLSIVKRTPHKPFTKSHGSTCAAIIKKYSTTPLYISSIKVLGKNFKGSPEQLEIAIKWCVSKKIKVLNISLGSIYYKDIILLRNAVNYANKYGTIIIAACNNNNIYTIPAAFTNVIGVRCDLENKLLEKDHIYYRYPIDGIEIAACGKHTLYSSEGKKITTHPSNSFATPIITAKVCNLLHQNTFISLIDIKKILHDESFSQINKRYYPNYVNYVDWLRNSPIILTDISENILLNTFKNNTFFKVNKINVINFTEILNMNFQYINTIYQKRNILIYTPNILHNTIKTRIICFIHYLAKFGNNIIFLDDRMQYKLLICNIIKYDIKIWHTSFQGNFYNYNSKYLINEIPIITILSKSKNNLLNLLCYLDTQFGKEKYQSVSLMDWSICILYDLLYINPFKKLKNIQTYIQNIKRVYSPDILLIGLSNQKVFNEIRLSRNKLSIDVLVDIQVSVNFDVDIYLEWNNCKKKYSYSGYEKNFFHIFNNILKLFRNDK